MFYNKLKAWEITYHKLLFSQLEVKLKVKVKLKLTVQIWTPSKFVSKLDTFPHSSLFFLNFCVSSYFYFIFHKLFFLFPFLSITLVLFFRKSRGGGAWNPKLRYPLISNLRISNTFLSSSSDPNLWINRLVTSLSSTNRPTQVILARFLIIAVMGIFSAKANQTSKELRSLVGTCSRARLWSRIRVAASCKAEIDYWN